jgi:predicted nuclease of predicted toxin-antitoxin system
MQEEVRFFADESVERRIVAALRAKYSVVYVDEIMKGADDDTVLQNAEEQKAILITADKDFGELVHHGQRLHSGIILYRLHGLAIEEKIRIIMAAIATYGSELSQSFTVITQQNIRIRKRQP